jgi:lactate racemase
VMQLAAVLNNELWTSSIASLLRSEQGLSRPLQMWNALPSAVRHRAARVMRASYRPISALAGPPDAVAPRALELFLRQHEVQAQGGEADVLIFGLPDLGPFSVGTAQNPVLVTNLALGFIANLFTRAPLLREGGVIIFLNPLTPSFDARAHRPHLDFYEKVLRVEREPEGIHERYEPYLAARPELVADYQRRYAFHGAHPLLAWYQCAPARRRTSRIIVAGGDPRACARLGLMGSSDIDDALRKAKEALAMDAPKVRVLELPPPFFVKV